MSEISESIEFHISSILLLFLLENVFGTYINSRFVRYIIQKKLARRASTTIERWVQVFFISTELYTVWVFSTVNL